MAEIVALIRYRMGGRPGEYLMHRLGSPVSADTILRQLKRDNPATIQKDNIRVLGIDDWSWPHSLRYGTIMVDLERHSVVMNAARMAGMGAMLLFSDPSGGRALRAGQICSSTSPQTLCCDVHSLGQNDRIMYQGEPLNGVGPPDVRTGVRPFSQETAPPNRTLNNASTNRKHE
jgi:hypothetical protein